MTDIFVARKLEAPASEPSVQIGPLVLDLNLKKLALSPPEASKNSALPSLLLASEPAKVEAPAMVAGPAPLRSDSTTEEKRLNTVYDLTTHLHGEFDKFNTLNKGFLSSDELVRAAKLDPSRQTTEAALYFVTHFKETSDLQDDTVYRRRSRTRNENLYGISKYDLDALKAITSPNRSDLLDYASDRALHHPLPLLTGLATCGTSAWLGYAGRLGFKSASLGVVAGAVVTYGVYEYLRRDQVHTLDAKRDQIAKDKSIDQLFK